MKNNTLEIIMGFVLGIVITILGAFLFTLYLNKGSFIATVKYMYYHNSLGKLITLGALFNVALVYIYLKKTKIKSLKE